MKNLILFLLLLPIFTSAQPLPDWLYGEWDGIGKQSNTQTEWLTWLTFYSDDAAPVVEYPGLECSGHWELQKIEDKTLVFKEVITKSVGRCSQYDRVYVRFKMEGVIEVSYAHNYAPDRIIATLTLRRRQLP